jgi:cell division protein ZapA
MTKEVSSTTIEILGKTYQIKCPESETDSLQQAAAYLEDKMRITRDVTGVLSIDRIAVITALNIAHQLVNLENQKNNYLQMEQGLRGLQNKLEVALTPHAQLELTSAD